MLHESDDDLDDYEFPDEQDDEPESALAVCSSCGSDIYEDSEQCPVCGCYVLNDTHAFSGRATWWILLGILGIAATLFTFIFF